MVSSRATRLAAAAAALVLVMVLARPASAQGWLADRDMTEGPGIRLGDFELHPGLGVELGWDSNLYYTSDNPAPGLAAPLDSAILRVTPHLLFSTLGAQRREEGEARGGPPPVVQFRGGISGSYYEYFNDETRRNFGLDVGLTLTVLEGQPFSFRVSDTFGRTVRPFTENTSGTSVARDHNDAAVDFTFSTPGQVLQIGAGYTFGFNFFEGTDFQYGNSFTHTVRLSESFRFLPQTALVHQTSVGYNDYYQAPPATDPSRPFLRDSVRLSTLLGLNGAITNEVSFLAMAGYGAGFFDGTATYDQDYDAFLARAEIRWRPVEALRLTLGYSRDAHPSFVGNYFTQDRGYFSTQLLVGGVFLLSAEVGLGYYDFGQIVAADGVTMIGNSTERTDIRFTGSLFAEYRFTEWLGVNGNFQYMGNFTDFAYRVDLMGTPILDPAQFNKIELWLGVRVFY